MSNRCAKCGTAAPGNGSEDSLAKSGWEIIAWNVGKNTPIAFCCACQGQPTQLKRTAKVAEHNQTVLEVLEELYSVNTPPK